MIRDNIPISMTESLNYLGEGEKQDNMKIFVKKFVKIKPEKALELREKLTALKMLKVKQEHISKIIDLLPEKEEDMNKIFNDISLDEDESKKILETIKPYI